MSAATGRPALAALLLGTFAAAAGVRWLAYTGFFGSDEVTYILHGFRLLDGDWRIDDYVGANRLGINIPIAALAALLGRNEAGAAAWSLLCSVGEVVLLAWAAARMFGLRTAWVAGLLLATLPMHVHYGGRIMADAPLALAITGCFVAFHAGLRSDSVRAYLLAGFLAGLSWWIKPVTIFVFGALLAVPLVERRFDPRWLWVAAGMLLALVLNGLLYLELTGNFWYVIDNVRERQQSGYLQAGLAAGNIRSEPWHYLTYLFGRAYHTGLLGPLAALGLLMALRVRGTARAGGDADREKQALRLVLVWGLGILLLMSLLPVSLRPLAFIPKQTNYMLTFAAPLCLLAAWGLTRLAPRVCAGLTAAAVAVGVGLALLLQANVLAFTANSWRTLDFVRELPPGQVVHVMSNAFRAAQFRHLVGNEDLRERIRDLEALAQPADSPRLVVIDPETFAWDSGRPWRPLESVPACWQPVQELRAQPSGTGTAMVGVLHRLVPLPVLERLLAPTPARVYRIPAGC